MKSFLVVLALAACQNRSHGVDFMPQVACLRDDHACLRKMLVEEWRKNSVPPVKELAAPSSTACPNGDQACWRHFYRPFAFDKTPALKDPLVLCRKDDDVCWSAFFEAIASEQSYLRRWGLDVREYDAYHWGPTGPMGPVSTTGRVRSDLDIALDAIKVAPRQPSGDR